MTYDKITGKKNRNKIFCFVSELTIKILILRTSIWAQKLKFYFSSKTVFGQNKNFSNFAPKVNFKM